MNVKVQKIADTWVIDPMAMTDHNFQNQISELQREGFIRLVLDKPGTAHSRNQQNLWHKLVSIFYSSGLHSSGAYDSLRETLKLRYGVISNAVYSLPDGNISVRKPYHNPPLRYTEKSLILKSTSVYSKDEYQRLISGTISEMLQAGVTSSLKHGSEFQEIVESMESHA